ncbi:molybdopterin molybdotransferase MoeA [Reichenbachiella agariperforans]|uniref:molybdopterin molybdotransferase MoeA n=1 Tax=Reichenbachiella agariperforans TaxID=156994 RepID=UPI001C090EB4|nr:molybdopterin molybdotransferase MoeA [Reichenbachiella agariperforans]MBU2913681.1 molybdopterin molybdotransferase MoeA [Reichenbachiella agariperforans]
MISVEEARNIIHAHAPEWGEERVLLHESIGRVLARPVVADRDFPPFHRVTMDGVAIRYEDFKRGERNFKVVGTQYAGEESRAVSNPGECLEIMTGAMLDASCDVIVRYEDVTFEDKSDGKWAHISDEEVFRFKNVHQQGSDQQTGEVLVESGTQIHTGIVAILATVGQEQVTVRRLPKIAVVSTGDELVEVGDTPQAYQIRKSNVTMIVASLMRQGIACQAFHLNDRVEELERELPGLLEAYDVLLLSGGVSKGKADYLPEVLESLGVQKAFHRVAQRPGKPFWFGSYGEKAVFAFPGNPISTLMCFQVYCLPWIYQQAGVPNLGLTAMLMEDFVFKPDLGYFLQVSVSHEGGQCRATPVQGNGSGDLATLAKVDGFIYLPAGQMVYGKGDVFPYYPLGL